MNVSPQPSAVDVMTSELASHPAASAFALFSALSVLLHQRRKENEFKLKALFQKYTTLSLLRTSTAVI